MIDLSSSLPDMFSKDVVLLAACDARAEERADTIHFCP
eukprot:SAG31_NODE_23981_length_491_cov_11.647959_1_plen_37_part_01